MTPFYSFGGYKNFEMTKEEVTPEDLKGILMVFPIPNDKALIGSRISIPYNKDDHKNY